MMMRDRIRERVREWGPLGLNGSHLSLLRPGQAAVRAAAGTYDLRGSVAWGMVCLPFITLAVYALLILWPVTRSVAVWALREDRPVEIATFFFFFIGGWYGLALARQMYRQGKGWFVTGFYALFAVFLLFVAMEEISWGQWPFGYATPPAVAEVNLQGEMTIHNLSIWRTHLEVFPLMYGLCGLLGIWLGQRPLWRKVAPSPLLAPWFGLIAVFAAVDLVQDFVVIQPQFDRMVDYLDELVEMLVGLSGLLLVWLNARRWQREWSETAVVSPAWRAKIATFAHAVTSQASTRLLCFLLTADAIFIVLHLLYQHTGLIADPAFRLDWEQGYPEIFQYLKMAGILIMLAALTRWQPAPVYFHWLLLFLYFLLDDAFMIHETVGGMLAQGLALSGLWGARPQDVGELLVYGLAGLFFLTTLTITYQRSSRPARELSQYLILLMAALLFFGVALDIGKHMINQPSLYQLLGILEDGGEHLVLSLTAWFVLVWVTPRLGWETRTGAWVRTIVEGATLLVLLLLLFSFVQFGTQGLAGNDGYYHAKMGWLMRQQGVKPDPPQLPFTVLHESAFYNHHFLYHVYLSFFDALDPAADGGQSLTYRAKEASVVLAAVAIMSLWWLLRRQGVAWAFLWALGAMAASEAFLYRLSMPRAQSLSLLVLILGLHWLLQKKYRWLLPLGFIYVWSYNAFPLLLLVAGVYFVSIALTEQRLAWPALVYPAAGIGLGLIVNPYFPQNIIFIFNHLGPKLLPTATRVGVEWYPYETWTLVQNSGVALGLYWLGMLALAWCKERVDGRTLTLFLLTAVLGLMLLRSRRFIEYFPAFVLIFTALTASPWLTTWHAKLSQQSAHLLGQVRLPDRFRDHILPRYLLPAGMILLLLPLLLTSVRAARESVSYSAPPDQYAAAALWLRTYSEPGSVIFQTDWDDFPRLFFYNSEAVYSVGLDPTYMELHDPTLFRTWVQITQGQLNAPGTVIAGQFGADFVFTDLDHDAFLRQATADPLLEEIYRDEYAVIFRVD